MALPQRPFPSGDKKHVVNRCHSNDMVSLAKSMPQNIYFNRVPPMEIII